MYTFRSVAKDFERPFDTHMPQSHNNRNRRRPSRRYPENKRTGDIGLVQATDVVPPTQGLVESSLMWADTSGTIFDVPGAVGRIAPLSTLDTKVCEGHKKEEDALRNRIPCPKVRQLPKLAGVAGEEQHALVNTSQEAFSPVRTFKWLPDPPEFRTRYSSPIFDELSKLHTDVQEIILGDIEKDSNDVLQTRQHVISDENLQIEEAKDNRWPRNLKIFSDMELTDSGWAQPLYDIAAPAASSAIDALSNAMGEMRVFREIRSLPPEDRNYKASGVTTPLVNISNQPSAGEKADAAHGRAGGERHKRESETVDKFYQLMSSKGSLKSVQSASSDGFERLEMPVDAESEQSGGRRKWYRIFHR